MADYVIQKRSEFEYDIKRNGGWVHAWGLTTKSIIQANNDAEAIQIFKERTKKVRTPYRLITFGGYGYNVQEIVIAVAGIQK